MTADVPLSDTVIGVIALGAAFMPAYRGPTRWLDICNALFGAAGVLLIAGHGDAAAYPAVVALALAARAADAFTKSKRRRAVKGLEPQLAKAYR